MLVSGKGLLLVVGDLIGSVRLTFKIARNLSDNLLKTMNSMKVPKLYTLKEAQGKEMEAMIEKV